jgi:nucleoid-associated protein YgaU
MPLGCGERVDRSVKRALSKGNGRKRKETLGMKVEGSVRARCVVVAVGLTVAAWGAAAVLTVALGTSRSTTTPETADAALLRLCLVALVVAVAWGWLQGLVAVTEAWRGADRATRPGVVRRVVLVACGVAAVSVLAGPAADATPRHPGPDILIGLPLPERAVGPAHPAERTTVIRPGDTLWALAASELGPDASAADIGARWRLIYRRNRAVIGADPDLIRPGQPLALPHLTTKLKTREPT